MAGAAGGSLLAACGDSDSASADTLERARKAGVLRVGFANEVPIAFANKNGELEGASIAVCEAVMKKLGVPKIEGVLVTFAGLIPGLNARRFDMIPEGMFILPERCQQSIFTDAYSTVPEAIAVKASSDVKPKDYTEVAKAGISLGVVTGAVEGTQASASGVSDDKIKKFSDTTSLVEGMKQGRVDAISLTSIALKWTFRGSSEFDISVFTPVIDGKEQINGIGWNFRKDDVPFRNKVNDVLVAMKRNDELLPLMAKYGYTEQELGPAVSLTAKQLCNRKV